MSWDLVQVIVAVVTIIFGILSLVSSIKRNLNGARRLRLRWTDLNILGLILLMISSILSTTGSSRGIFFFLTIIGCLFVFVALIWRSTNRSRHQGVKP